MPRRDCICSALPNLCLGLALLWADREAAAADTVETWDVGATNVDFYTGYEGIGAHREDRAVFGDLMLGYGLVRGLSASLGITLSAADTFTDGSADIYLGLFGTPLDTDHVDLDMFVDFAVGGPGLRDFSLTPMLELNVDLAPDLGSWGFYVRAGAPIHGEVRDGEPRRHVDVALKPGTYVSLGERHQLLLEFDLTFHDPRDEERTEIGGVAVGYNVVLADPIELINQVYVNLPQHGETATVGLMTGLIVTMPTAASGS